MEHSQNIEPTTGENAPTIPEKEATIPEKAVRVLGEQPTNIVKPFYGIFKVPNTPRPKNAAVENANERKRKTDEPELDIKVGRVEEVGSGDLNLEKDNLIRKLQAEAEKYRTTIKEYKTRLQKVRESEMDMITKEDAIESYEMVKKELTKMNEEILEKNDRIKELEEMAKAPEVASLKKEVRELQKSSEEKDLMIRRLQRGIKDGDEGKHFRNFNAAIKKLTKENSDLRDKLKEFKDYGELRMNLFKAIERADLVEYKFLESKKRVQELECGLDTNKVSEDVQVSGEVAILQKQIEQKDQKIKKLVDHIETDLKRKIEQLTEEKEDAYESLQRINLIRIKEREELNKLTVQNQGLHSSLEMITARCDTYKKQHEGYCRDMKEQVEDEAKRLWAEEYEGKVERCKRANASLRQKLNDAYDENQYYGAELNQKEQEAEQLTKRCNRLYERFKAEREEKEDWTTAYWKLKAKMDHGEEHEEEEEEEEVVEEEVVEEEVVEEEEKMEDEEEVESGAEE